jgi:hypothetical protein
LANFFSVGGLSCWQIDCLLADCHLADCRLANCLTCRIVVLADCRNTVKNTLPLEARCIEFPSCSSE